MKRMLQQVAACLRYARKWPGWTHQDRNQLTDIESRIRSLADRFDRITKENT